MILADRLRDYFSPREKVDTSPKVSDEVKCTTCYMCACRCGIKVHLKDGGIRYIEGNRDHPVNRGVICGKGASGIMQQHSPAKLKKPLIRVGERGSGEFREIEWEEAIATAVGWLSSIRATDPKKLAFFTGRDQSQSLTGYWAAQFGTPNFAAHGGFCSVNMAAAGMYTLGGSFWEFGEPDWALTRFFMMFGVAEDHDSNPIKIALSGLRRRGAKFVSVNPVRTGYSAIADEWIGIRPGTDGLFVLALIHELLKADRVDLDYLGRYTNAGWLVIQAPGMADDGLFARNEAGEPLVLEPSGSLASGMIAGISARLAGEAVLPDGRRAVPVFQLLAERYLDPSYAPEAVAETCGIPATTIRRLASEMARVAFEQEIELAVPWTDWAGRRHESMRGRPVSLHAMRGISAHSNGFQTCRALHLLQLLLGTIDVPGGWRYKSPHPKPCPPGPKPTGKPEQIVPGKPLAGVPLGYPLSPEDLIIDTEGRPARIDKAFSWDAPIAAHGMMQMVIANAWKGDPYPIDTLFMYMANMAWNSAMNTAETMRMLTDKDPATGGYRIPRIIYSDAYYSETVAYADLVLPDTTYLERWDCISLLDRPIGSSEGPADAIRQPIVAPDRDVRPFQDVHNRDRRAARATGFCHAGGRAALPRRLPRLHRQSRTPARCRSARRLARCRGRSGGPRRAQPPSARALYRERLFLETRAAKGPAILQARQQGLSRNRRGYGTDRCSRTHRAAALCRASATLSPRRPRTWQGSGARDTSRAHRDIFRPAAVLVHAVRGSARRRRELPATRADPAADADVPFLAFAERLAAADPRRQSIVREPGERAGPRTRGGRLGLAVEP